MRHCTCTNFGYISREAIYPSPNSQKILESAIFFTHRLHVLFEGEQIIEATAERPAAVVDGVTEHSERENVAFFAAGFREDELRGQEI